MTAYAFREALEDILGVPRGVLKDTDSRETIDTWSSIADVQILTTISSEFGIEPEPDLVQAETVGELLQALAGRNVFSA